MNKTLKNFKVFFFALLPIFWNAIKTDHLKKDRAICLNLTIAGTFSEFGTHRRFKTDEYEDVVMTSYYTPSNHLFNTSSFKGKDT